MAIAIKTEFCGSVAKNHTFRRLLYDTNMTNELNRVYSTDLCLTRVTIEKGRKKVT